MANITTEESSPVVLGSLRPDPANRLFDVVPDYQHVGPIRVAMDRSIHAFTLREDYTLAFTIKHLAPSQLDDALYVKAYLMTGGQVTLNTSDASDTSYSNLTLAPGTTPEIKLDDEERLHYSFSCVLADDEPIVVNYAG